MTLTMSVLQSSSRSRRSRSSTTCSPWRAMPAPNMARKARNRRSSTLCPGESVRVDGLPRRLLSLAIVGFCQGADDAGYFSAQFGRTDDLRVLAKAQYLEGGVGH